ncbi:MAG: substrate-binding domain-containing protein [Opitutales bacterium]|nr:substrate-binding domain-containing protein [Opitutales bacterium]
MSSPGSPAVLRSRRYRVAVFTATHLDFGKGIAEGVLEFARRRPAWDIVLVAPVGELARLQPGRDRLEGIIGHLARGFDPAVLRSIGACSVGVSNLCAGPFPVPRILNDDRRTGALAAEHLLERDFRRFVYLGIDGHNYSTEREAGFRERLADGGATLHAVPAGLETWGGRLLPAVRDWLAGLPKPVGVFAANDFLATKFMRRVLDAGWQVPEDVAILGVDNERIQCAVSPVALSSVALDTARMGFLAAERLDRLMAGARDPGGDTLVPPKGVVARASSDAVAVTDPFLRQVHRYIRDHLHEGIGIAEIARAVNASRRTLERRFLDARGTTPYRELTLARVRRAKDLLANTDESVEAIASETGFSEARFLTQNFKKAVGMTPSAFRRRRG